MMHLLWITLLPLSNFKEVLLKAQKLGYAEPVNPLLDLNGYDALAKVKI